MSLATVGKFGLLLVFAVLVVVAASIFLVYRGAVDNSDLLIFLGGLIPTLAILGFHLFAAPIIKHLSPGVTGDRTIAQRYYKGLNGLLLSVLSLVLFTILVPIHSNPALIIVLLVSGTISAMILPFSLVRTVSGLVGIVTFVSTVSLLLFPKTVDGFINAVPTRVVVDDGCDLLENVHFFDRAGNPLLWYHTKATGEYEWFDAPGLHHQTRSKLIEATPQAVQQHSLLVSSKCETDRLAREQEAERIADEREEIRRQAAERINSTKTAEAERARLEQLELEQRYLDETRRKLEEEINRYVGNPIGNRPSVTIKSDGIWDIPASGRLASLLNGSSAVFTASFMESPFYVDAFGGSPSILIRWGILSKVERVVIGEVTTSIRPNPSVGSGWNTGNADIVIRVFLSDGSSYLVTSSFRGGGFSVEQARKNVIDGVIDKISTKL
jgi:hypothetical protein